jgi:hypothetical protein
MGKKVIRLTESDLFNIVKRVIKEQRISDLPQNQQPSTPKPNIGSQKPKDLRTTLSPRQQQQYKDMTKGQKDLSKVYYGSKEKMSPVGKGSNVVEKVRLIFPKSKWEEVGLFLLKQFKIFTGYFRSLGEALQIVDGMINDGVKTKELVIGSHGGGEQLLMTQSGENFKFDNSFLEKIKQIITPSTKVFFTACHGADDLEMLKDAAEKLGVGAYAASGVYNYVTNKAERGFFYCSANPIDRTIGSKIEQPTNPVNEQKKSGEVQIRFLSQEKPEQVTYTITTNIFGSPITITKPLNFDTKNYGGSNLHKGSFLIEGWVRLRWDIQEYIGGYTENQDALAKAWYSQSKKTPNMDEYLGTQFVDEKIIISVNGVNVKSLKPFSLPNAINNAYLLNNGFCAKVSGAPVSWTESVN